MITLNALGFYQNHQKYTLRENGYWGSKPLCLKNRAPTLLGVAMGSANMIIIPDTSAGVMALSTVTAHKTLSQSL